MAKKENTLETKLEKLTLENKGRVAQVEQWNTNIVQLKEEINKAKEAHDYTRGQIELLTQMISEAGDNQ